MRLVSAQRVARQRRAARVCCTRKLGGTFLPGRGRATQHRDTLAMVRLVETLEGLAPVTP
ncbi:MAG: hypothetical protein ACRERE_34425 [Candidatus Entotheonellia bacterium]